MGKKGKNFTKEEEYMSTANKKTNMLKKLIKSDKLDFLMEAHNGVSAKIVEETGFKGIWGSGLSLSASMGVRDNNELSWTQVLDILEFMNDATTIPILLDGDTGYGNYNNVRRLIRKLEQYFAAHPPHSLKEAREKIKEISG